MNANTIYTTINEAVLKGLETKGLEWFKPWKAGEHNQPINYSNSKPYRGLNIFMLNAVMIDKGYEFNQWLTYKQAQAKGGQIRKGEKSTDVYFFKIGYQDLKTGKYQDTEPEHGEYRKTFALRFYKVFNIAQADDLDPIPIQEPIKADNEPIDEAQIIVDSYISREKINFRSIDKNRAYYMPKLDIINMPDLETFNDSDSYYKVFFHEIAHSTGHETRLNRPTLLEFQKWGDNTYAKEELVAEISAMYMTGILGLDPEHSLINSQAYIQGWCKYLKDKPKECVNAMQQATKVVDYITKNNS